MTIPLALGDLTKLCSKCRRMLPLAEFPTRKDRGSRPRSHCKPCHNAPQQTEHGRRRLRNSALLRKYGITTDDYDEMVREQNGQCAICRSSGELLHVDHCHETGRLRGLLCSHCNKGLGHFKDEPERLLAAVQYLLGIIPG
ncbi:MAG TPA: endonuclease VII domain-containing protein [Jiangellales bacterium]|nr:endonuclease VII domain-containing protein [Jiangellales bacterium]